MDQATQLCKTCSIMWLDVIGTIQWESKHNFALPPIRVQFPCWIYNVAHDHICTVCTCQSSCKSGLESILSSSKCLASWNSAWSSWRLVSLEIRAFDTLANSSWIFCCCTAIWRRCACCCCSSSALSTPLRCSFWIAMLECQALKDQHSVVRSVRERQCSKRVGYCDAVWLTTFVGIAGGSSG